jgi:hypothetical protein
MSVKSLFVSVVLAALPVVGTATVATAQTPPAPRYAERSPPTPAAQRRTRPRIEINPHPQRLLYRRCVDWYELQHRPSGTVLYPQMRCWWVRG